MCGLGQADKGDLRGLAKGGELHLLQTPLFSTLRGLKSAVSPITSLYASKTQ